MLLLEDALFLLVDIYKINDLYNININFEEVKKKLLLLVLDKESYDSKNPKNLLIISKIQLMLLQSKNNEIRLAQQITKIDFFDKFISFTFRELFKKKEVEDKYALLVVIDTIINDLLKLDSKLFWEKRIEEFYPKFEILVNSFKIKDKIDKFNKLNSLPISNLLKTIPNIFKVLWIDIINDISIDNISELILKNNKNIKNADKNLNVNYDLNILLAKGKKEINNNFLKKLNNDSNIKNFVNEYLFGKPIKLKISFYIFNEDKCNLLFGLFEILVGYFVEKDKKALNDIYTSFWKKLDIKYDSSNELINQKIMASDINLQKKLIDNFAFIRNNPNLIKDIKLRNYWIFDEKERREKSLRFINKKLMKFIQSFLDKHYPNKYDFNGLQEFLKNPLLVFYWEELFCWMDDNWELFKNENIDDFIYKYIYIYEMNVEGYSKKDLLKENEIYNGTISNRIKTIIKDNYVDSREKLKNHFDIYKKYIDSENIDLITFVDNNLLSSKSRLLFSKKERMGDKLYRFVINILMLECKIQKKEVESYMSAEFQNVLCSSLKINEIIQSNKLHFGSKEKYEDADYFECLIYEIFRTKNWNIKLLTEFIFELFKENANNLIEKDGEWRNIAHNENWVNNLTHINSFSPLLLENELNIKIINQLVEVNNTFLNYLFIKEYEASDKDFQRISNIWFRSSEEKISLHWQLYYFIQNDFKKYLETSYEILKYLIEEKKWQNLIKVKIEK